MTQEQNVVCVEDIIYYTRIKSFISFFIPKYILYDTILYVLKFNKKEICTKITNHTFVIHLLVE